jgi:hypothetical protein
MVGRLVDAETEGVVAEEIGRSQPEQAAESVVRRNTRLFVRATFLVAAALVVAFFVQVLIDAVSPSTPLGEALRRPWTGSAEELEPAIANVSRTFNQLIAVVIMALAIAVPLTANMYTPKLLEIFLGDRFNRIVLGLFLFSTVNTLWVAARIGRDHVPRFGLGLTFVLLLACFAVILPYFFYVFRFLHPAHILERLREAAAGRIRELPKLTKRGRVSELQADLRERIEHIASLGMRSLDRADREVAQGALTSIAASAEAYSEVKADLPQRWFTTRFADTMRMSSEAIEALEQSRTWVEMECLQQVELLFMATMAEATDLVGAACQVVRQVGMRAVRDGDEQVLELTRHFLHSFLRASMNRRDVRSAYHVLYQYRLFAEQLLTSTPECVAEIGRRLRYYASIAVQSGVPFVAETIAYDLGTLTFRAYEAKSPAFEPLIEAFGKLPRKGLAGRPLSGAHKASVILAARLTHAGEPEHAAGLVAPVKEVDGGVRAAIFADLLDEPPERFWEVTDRLVNFDYTPPEVRAAIAGIKRTL